LREFEKVSLIDEDNLQSLEVPRYYKSVYVPDDRFMLIGGLERLTAHSSTRCFLIDESAKLSRLPDMTYGRQYFSTCIDDWNAKKTYVYVISGFSHEHQLLPDVERFCLESRSWEELEPVNVARINASATKCGEKYVYLFGGLDVLKNEFTDSIERYNSQLSIWTILNVKLPNRIANLFTFSLNPNMILIMGGIVKKDSARIN
jgi:hypothetical protein